MCAGCVSVRWGGSSLSELAVDFAEYAKKFFGRVEAFGRRPDGGRLVLAGLAVVISHTSEGAESGRTDFRAQRPDGGLTGK